MKQTWKGFVAIAAIFLGFGGLSYVGFRAQPAVADSYWKKTETGGELEAAYTAPGASDVSVMNVEAPAGRLTIYYPEELTGSDAVYPAVIIANSTGVPASRYTAVFRHLASHGFIVVGNEEENPYAGVSAEGSLAGLLSEDQNEDSLLCGHVNRTEIGLAGYGQGAAAILHAAATAPSGTYSALYTASLPQISLASARGWNYDASSVTEPLFMTAGTGETDQTICPLTSLTASADLVKADVPVVIARRRDADYSDMMALGDGYMTAWFSWLLQDDEQARSVFLGTAELAHNENWQDVLIRSGS